MQQRLLPPVQILVYAEVGFASSFLTLITLIIGTKDVNTFHYFSRVYVRGWLVHVCLLGYCAVHVTGLSDVVSTSIINQLLLLFYNCQNYDYHYEQ